MRINSGRVEIPARQVCERRATLSAHPGHVHSNDELATDLAGQILERLRVKSDKPYPPGTVLIFNCIPNGLILDSEWKDAIERVTNARLHVGFREVFLVETVMSHSTTLYGDRKRGSRRKPK
jgi:hypothetical protein